MSLLSIPALVWKDIAVLFMPGSAPLLDIRDGFETLGYAAQAADELFYVSENGSTQQPNTTGSSVARALAKMTKNMPKMKVEKIVTEAN